MKEESEKLMELTPKELRVGNYVNYENTTHVVDEIHKQNLVHHWCNTKKKEYDVYTTTYHQILSIPISPKEIEKLGFMKDEERVRFNPDLYFDNEGLCIEDDAGTYWLCRHNDEDDVTRIATIDYVHELQNLYYSLRKKELTY